MRILQLSTFDEKFGAAIAARRLHEALLGQGAESDLLVNKVLSSSPRVHQAYTGFQRFRARVSHSIDKLPARFYLPPNPWQFSANWMPSPIARRVEALRPDIVHLHWCETNFVPIGTLPQFRQPLIWTFHDMWAFTGGCHYTDGCERYLTGCGKCPILESSHENDLSSWLWNKKHKAYRGLQRPMHVVCPSAWMADLARQAPLLEGVPVHVIPNPISAQIFAPRDRKSARRELGLPQEGRLVLMGTAAIGDHRKGFDLLDAALKLYADDPGSEPLGLVILGSTPCTLSSTSDKLKIVRLGFMHNEATLGTLYNAIDLVALPSREENLSNMLAESLSCGTPCLTFAIGGNGDLITHQINGYMARPNDSTDMATGLAWILAKLGEAQRAEIARAAHEKVSWESLVPVFLRLYESALAAA